MSRQYLRDMLLAKAPVRKRTLVALERDGEVFEVEILKPTIAQSEQLNRTKREAEKAKDPVGAEMKVIFEMVTMLTVVPGTDEQLLSKEDVMRLRDEDDESWFGQLLKAFGDSNPKTKEALEEEIPERKRKEEIERQQHLHGIEKKLKTTQ